MIIRPGRDYVDEFVICLSSQELKNIQEGIQLCHGSAGSPWSRNVERQIERALADQYEYRNKKWE